MPTNPDPAETLDIPSLLRDLFAENRETTIAAVETAARKIVEAQGANDYSSGSFMIAANSPVRLLSYDRNRVRAKVRASVDDVFIGTLAQLSGGLGFPVPTGGDFEIQVIGDVYVAFIPQSGSGSAGARVALWIERAV